MSDIALDSLMDTNPILALGQTRKPSHAANNPAELVLEWGELTEEHVEAAREFLAAGANLGTPQKSIKHLRHSHHRLAQLLANGVAPTVAGPMCNYAVQRVRDLQMDPAFQELMSHYADEQKAEWADFVQVSAGLSLDLLQEIQRRLDENPEQFTLGELRETVKVVADRSGNAPVTKSVSLNVNADIGTRLARARARLQAEDADVDAA